MPPNVLLITCDQLRKQALGCFGNEIVQTPNIDRLAALGVRFDHAFAAYPVCAPNRASIATGRYPSVHGVNTNGIFLPEDEITLMEILRQRGYATYGAGKMHFGPQWRYPPDGGVLKDPHPEWAVNPQPQAWEFPWHGFEKVQITEDHRVGPYADYLAEHGYDVWDDPHSFTYPQHICVRSVYPKEHHQTTWIGDRSIDYLTEHPTDQPFFLWTSFVRPHSPFVTPAPYDTMYDPADMPLPVWDEAEVDLWPEVYRQRYFADGQTHSSIGMHRIPDSEWQQVKAFYYGMITHIDDQIGRILTTLEERGMLKNTIILFTTDHGEMLGDHHLMFKGTAYDAVTSVPVMITQPDSPAPGAVRNLLANSVDIVPTVLDLLGIPVPDGVQGHSLVPALRDTSFEVRDAVLIEHGGPRRTVRTKGALLTWHGRGQRGELYDLHEDPHCLKNLWDRPDKATLQREMLDTLIHLMANNLDPLPPRAGAC